MKTFILGAGASGLMTASMTKATVLERNEKAGKKLYITGKGRCNLLNSCQKEDFLKNVVNGEKFLFSAISAFSPSDTMEYFENIGLKLKTERGNRVFPLSEKSSDVIKCLLNESQRQGSEFIYNTFVKDIIKRETGYLIVAENEEFFCDNLVFALGGKSYPLTGSDGSGYSLVKRLEHNIVEPTPALTSFILEEDVESLEGLSLKNVRATVTFNGKQKSEFGEMLFTDKGVSGPIILSLSSHINRHKNCTLSIDLKPALTEETLNTRILTDFNKNINKQLKNSLDELLPKSLIPFIIKYGGFDENKKVNSITREERIRLIDSLKNLKFSIKSLKGFNEAIITSGGVCLNEVNPKTMESKINKNLYIIGEMLDLDALTGGFNLQIAWSTAYLASKAINGEKK